MSDQLIEQFLQAINNVSYYNAGEGNNYWAERDAAAKAEAKLRELKSQMVEQYGKQETKRIANSRPHLLFSELMDLD